MKKTCALLIFLFAASGCFSQSLESLIDSRYVPSLRSGEIVTRAQNKNLSPALVPGHQAVRGLVSETMTALAPNVMVETLYCYKKPSARNWSEAERTAVFNQVTALSTLAGIQYFSVSRNSMRIFYETSTVIENPENKKVLPDPSHASPPPSLTLYARQKDSTFGDNIYRYDYRCDSVAVIFSQENITALSYGIIPAVSKGRLRTVAAIIDTNDSLLIYVASMAKTLTLLGIGERIGESFSNRAEAVLKWFTAGAGRIFN